MSRPEHSLHHLDAAKNRGSDLPKFGKRYFHPKSGRIYVICGQSFDSQRELWMINYRPEGMREASHNDFHYSHTPEDFFVKGRFLEVKGGLEDV